MAAPTTADAAPTTADAAPSMADAAPTTAAPAPLWHSFVAGTCGGVAAVAVGHPFDTVKVRLQTARSLGPQLFRGLYSGVTASLCGVVPFWTVYYGGYKLGRRVFPDESSLLQGFCAGGVAGAVSAPVVVCSETIKTIAQAERKSSGDALRQILRQPGLLRRLLAVTPVTVAYMVPSQGVFYLSFEIASRHVAEAIAGGCAGVAEWSTSLPADTLRSKMYYDRLVAGGSRSAIEIARDATRARGVWGLYAGLAPALLRSFPANAAAFFAIGHATRALEGVS